MRDMIRMLPLLLAGILGYVAGLLTSNAGGAPERALQGIIVASVSLAVAGFVPAALAGAGSGWSVGALVTLGVFVVVLFAYYMATWVYSPFHSALGDSLFLAVSCVPASVASVCGLAVGRALSSRRSGTAR